VGIYKFCGEDPQQTKNKIAHRKVGFMRLQYTEASRYKFNKFNSVLKRIGTRKESFNDGTSSGVNFYAK